MLDLCTAAIKKIPTKSSSLKQLNKETRELGSELYLEGFSKYNTLANEGKPYTADQTRLPFQQWFQELHQDTWEKIAQRSYIRRKHGKPDGNDFDRDRLARYLGGANTESSIDPFWGNHTLKINRLSRP